MKNKRAEVSLVLVMALFLLAIVIIPAGAQLNATVSIGDITLAQGATDTFPIMIDAAPDNVSGAQINLAYDPTVVQVTAVVNISWDILLCNDTIEGERRMIGFQFLNPSLTPPIKFADVTVKAIGNPGDYTPLNLEVPAITMEHGTPYELELNNGSVSIIGVVPAYNSFGRIALIGLLAILMAISIRAKVKRR